MELETITLEALMAPEPPAPSKPKWEPVPFGGRRPRITGGVNSRLKNAFQNDIEPRWKPKRETPRYRIIKEMAVAGYNNKEIATALEMHPVAVSNILRQPESREYMIETIEKDIKGELLRDLNAAAKGALQRINDLAINASSETVRANMNVYLIDRILGKPTQVVQEEKKNLETLSDAELERIAASGPVAAQASGNAEVSDGVGAAERL